MDFDLFKPKAPPLFGLDISSSSVKMLEIVEAGKGAYRVERYAIEPLIRDTVVDGNISNLEQAADAVKRAHKRLGTRTKHVAMAVPTGAVITKKIVVAAGLREDELEIQVESEANQYIPFALEEVNLDFQSLGPTANNPEDQEVLIAATRKEKVEDRVAVAHLAGLKPLVMDVESFAQQAALSLVVQALPGGGKDQNIAVADVGDRDVLVLAAAGQRLHHQRQGRLLREGLDVHHQRLEAGEMRDRDTVLDLLLACGGDQHLLILGVVRRRAERLEIQIHFLERERNVLVRLAFDLDFELVLAQPRGHHDLLGDHRAGRHRHRDVLGARAEALVRALHRIGCLLEVADVAVDHGIAKERLDGVALDSVGTFARFDDLEHLYGRRADVQPEQRRRLRLEQVEIHTLFSFTYQPLAAIRRIRVKC